MTNFLTKTNLPNYCHKQFLLICTFYLLGFYLTLETHSPIYSIFTLSLLTYYSYFIHYLFHRLPDIIDLHIKYHHVIHSNNCQKTIHLIIETLVNIGFFAIVYGVQRLLQIEMIPTILIVYYGIIYVSIHIINYSLCHTSPKHVIHHATSNPTDNPATSATNLEKPTTKNYGPDIMDHLFGTNDDESFEDFNHMIPNILVAFFVSWYFFTPKKQVGSACLELVPMCQEP
jgi:hypothetical protein